MKSTISERAAKLLRNCLVQVQDGGGRYWIEGVWSDSLDVWITPIGNFNTGVNYCRLPKDDE